MDDKSEKGERSLVREVNLNEEFVLFDPSHTISRPGWLYDATESKEIKRITEFFSFVRLKSDKFPPLKYYIRASGGRMSRVMESITPFDPEVAYRITHEDFNPLLRKEKILNPDLWEGVDPDSAPLGLSVFANAEDDENKPLIRDPGFQERMKNLRLQLSFPSSTFEAEPQLGITFIFFYPVETGRFPPINFSKHGGFRLRVPQNLESLKQIKATFVSVAG